MPGFSIGGSAIGGAAQSIPFFFIGRNYNAAALFEYDVPISCVFDRNVLQESVFDQVTAVSGIFDQSTARSAVFDKAINITISHQQ